MKAQPNYTKLRGGYYTPPPIAEVLSSWAIRSSRDRILEPSCGDGVFLQQASERLIALGAAQPEVWKQICGYEIDAKEAGRAIDRLAALGIKKPGEIVRHTDFFAGAAKHVVNRPFDVALGNPPFIRYQNFPEAQRNIGFRLMALAGMKPNRLTNAWVPFLAAASLMVGAKGRIAMVIPAELFQVGYAADLRLFLTQHFSRIRLVTFKRLVFEGVQQEIVLLLAERSPDLGGGVDVLEMDDVSQLKDALSKPPDPNSSRSVDHSTEKWTQYFLTQKEIDLVRAIKSNTRLNTMEDVGNTDVGVVTGLNEFFAISGENARGLGLQRYSRRLVSRTNHLEGIIFRAKDWERNEAKGERTYLLDLPASEPAHLPEPVRQYVACGETKGFNLGYKCRIRKPWYIVPSVYEPTCFLTRQVHAYPKLTVNEANATSTDTVHRVRFLNGAEPRLVAAAFLNSLTFAFAELLGRSYGGGVLELEPREADRLPLPLINAEKLDSSEIDSLVRKGHIENVLSITNQILLVNGLGFSRKDVQVVDSIWKKLMTRRVRRRSTEAA